MKKIFNSEWIEWIRTNIDAGCDKDGIYKILLAEGYDEDDIHEQMNYRPILTGFNRNNGAQINRQSIHLPNAQVLHSDKIDLYTLDNFLNAEECEKVIALIKAQNKPSTLASDENDKAFRTSSTCDLGALNDEFMNTLDQRICKMIGIHPSYSESIQGQYYQIGQEFKPHTDYFETHEIEKSGGLMGQRTFTFMIYLNDVEAGGETEFPKLNSSFKPKSGMAVIWNSLNPDGSPNGNSLHHAHPVIKGYKAIITKWFRSSSWLTPAPAMQNKEKNELIPNYTKIGFEKLRLPEALHQKILDFYDEGRSSLKEEFVEGDFIVNAQNKNQKSSSNVLDLSPELRAEIHNVMKPLMENWCGQKLEPTFVYGIRVYNNQAILRPHRDRFDTHIISAIINVAQNVRTDWPLHIEDNYYRDHQVIMTPGDMIFYEGGRLQHGRPVALEGESFANIFCHFKPVDYVPPGSNKRKISDDWQEWIRSNMNAGNDKDGIFKILIDEGFDHDDIRREMNYEPSVSVQSLTNPFKATNGQNKNETEKIDRSRVFMANAQHLNIKQTDIYTIEEFLNTDECEKVIDLIKNQNKPSTLTSYESDKTFRTSSTCNLGALENDFIKNLDLRICKMLGIHPSYSESIQGQYYQIGQEFKAHTDYFETNELEKQAGMMGQRTFTFMIYLNDVEAGGDTEFPNLGTHFSPKKGMAVIWNSLNSDGTPNGNTLHHAHPVLKGYKAIITKWFRTNSWLTPAPYKFIKVPNEFIPSFTKSGLEKFRLPDVLHQKVRKFYHDNPHSHQLEFVEGNLHFNVANKNNASSNTVVDLSPELRQEIHDVLKPLMEAWCGKKLEPTFVYGIRIYKDQAFLKNHRDRANTHIISAIINIDQDVREDWTLHIEDNYYREHELILKPGEMLFYEGARLLHGRPIPLAGEYFANAFCHFKPVDYNP